MVPKLVRVWPIICKSWPHPTNTRAKVNGVCHVNGCPPSVDLMRPTKGQRNGGPNDAADHTHKKGS